MRDRAGSPTVISLLEGVPSPPHNDSLPYTSLIPIVETLLQARVLCVGDVMLDHYAYGHVERVSPEAPIPVLRIEREEHRLGGAGNVLANLHALGARANFISVIGNDAGGRGILRLAASLPDANTQILVERDRTTVVKSRYVAGHQQLLRVDRESVARLSAETRRDLLDMVSQAIDENDVVVISDYGKGVLLDGISEAIIARSRAAGRPVIVDPKGDDYSIYRGAAVLKPNRRELAMATKRSTDTDADVVAAAQQLITAYNFGAVAVSLSEKGVILVSADGMIQSLSAEAREVFDVTGAGDTMVAVLAAALGVGADLLGAARLANVAAGVVVGKAGTAVIHAPELFNAVMNDDALPRRKILPLVVALDHVARWRTQGLRIGFTNGCFDILHPGHISLLARARTECDRLVVGLNSDASVARIKGVGRPIQQDSARAAILASLTFVDLVVVFAEDSPLEVIKKVRPDVLVKGADYELVDVVGADVVRAYGGRVMLCPLTPGYSTSATVARMARLATA